MRKRLKMSAVEGTVGSPHILEIVFDRMKMDTSFIIKMSMISKSMRRLVRWHCEDDTSWSEMTHSCYNIPTSSRTPSHAHLVYERRCSFCLCKRAYFHPSIGTLAHDLCLNQARVHPLTYKYCGIFVDIPQGDIVLRVENPFVGKGCHVMSTIVRSAENSVERTAYETMLEHAARERRLELAKKNLIRLNRLSVCARFITRVLCQKSTSSFYKARESIKNVRPGMDGWWLRMHVWNKFEDIHTQYSLEELLNISRVLVDFDSFCDESIQTILLASFRWKSRSNERIIYDGFYDTFLHA